MKKAQFRTIAPQFVVADVRRTAEWYRDNLGFEILGYFFEEPPVYCITRRGNVEIHFGRSDTGAMRSNAALRSGLGNDAYIFVDDVVALHQELLAGGVEIVEGPVTRIYDCVEITIRDCNGMLIVFGASI